MNKTYKIDALPPRLVIGRQTETGVEMVQFDCTAWLSVWPEMEISVWPVRPGDITAYPAVIERAGNIITWTITDVDTAVDGEGSVEVMGIADGKRKLSARAVTHILASGLGNTQERPEGAKPWVDEVLDAAKRAENAAAEAAEVSAHPPIIGANGNWWLWDAEKDAYADSGKPSQGQGSGGIANETDPTVPEWAKQPEKPRYTAEEVGALSQSDLEAGVDAALAKAKESGEFDGKSGVYTGPDEPTDPSVNVWIDTDGDADAKIPEPYTLPTASAEVKGGVKIGEGLQMDGDVLGVVPEGEYELIENIELTEGVAAIERDESVLQRLNGCIVTMLTPPTSAMDIMLRVVLNNGISIVTGTRATDTSYTRSNRYCVQKNHGYWDASCQSQVKGWGSGNYLGQNNASELYVAPRESGIIKIALYSATANVVLPVGAIIKIWGVRA